MAGPCDCLIYEKCNIDEVMSSHCSADTHCIMSLIGVPAFSFPLSSFHILGLVWVWVFRFALSRIARLSRVWGFSLSSVSGGKHAGLLIFFCHKDGGGMATRPWG